MPFIEGTELIVARGMFGVTGNLYTGLHEFNAMGFMLHFLRPGDRSLDVGASVGSYSVLAAVLCGATCTAIEPVPAAFAALVANLRINTLEERVEGDNALYLRRPAEASERPRRPRAVQVHGQTV